MSRYVRWFSEIKENQPDSLGGKAANLIKLIQAGYLVPEAFYITEESYKDFIQCTCIQREISNFAKKINLNNFQELDSSIEKIKGLFLVNEIPKNIISEIDNAYSKLLNKCGEKVGVAVRSSALIEDARGASFAGQFATALNISTLENLIINIKKCWASLWSRRVIYYCQKEGFNYAEVYMAVIVQRMISSDISGVMFTSNPITQNKNELLINANWGLGETVASGEINPDIYIVSKNNTTVIKRQLGEKRLMEICLDYPEGGIAKIEQSQEKQNALTLDDEKVIKLVKLGQSIENYFEHPQDIEWAFLNNNLYILQSRPITGLNTEKEPEKFKIIWENNEDKSFDWDRKYIDERFPYPFTTIWGEIASVTLSDAVSYAIKKLGVPINFPVKYRTFNGYLYGIVLRKNIDFRILFAPFFTLHYIYKIDNNWDKIISKFISRRIDLERFDLKKATIAELMVHFKNSFKLWNEYFRYEILIGFLSAMIIPDFFLKFNFLFIGMKDDLLLKELFAGINNKTIGINKKLFALLNDIKKSEYLTSLFSHAKVEEIFNELIKNEQAKDFRDKFNKFIEEEGDRAGFEDGIEPEWKESPIIILALLQGYLGQNIKDIEDCQKKRNIERRGRIRIIHKKLSATFTDKIFPIKRIVFDKTLSLAQRFASLSEDSDYYIYKNRSLIRKVLLEFAKRLISEGLLNEQNDVFFLNLDELYKLGQCIEINDVARENTVKVVQERRRIWERQYRMIPPFTIARESKREKKTGEYLEKRQLKGVIGCHGLVTGKARIIFHPRDFYKFRAGEILVVPTTTPAWSPLFAIANGLVTDAGGALSHGAILSREYNIPAVLGARIATRLIKDGVLITVDGDKGVVYF